MCTEQRVVLLLIGRDELIEFRKKTFLLLCHACTFFAVSRSASRVLGCLGVFVTVAVLHNNWIKTLKIAG